ncbi:Asp-tRNA(Asn)/Glu-tRNA(Gln) amidotransferase GatCAB subunit A [filamentous cyanobacterium CCP5]|nr:Asp-tRNA(Asn)/Glu-tRNA(Gln) amidotransferase GatCAB subunit A [filamentous cyanobacterium CCP5]
MSSIRQLHQQLVSKERTAEEITQDYLQRIESLEPRIKSYLTVTAEAAIAQAQAVDQKIAAGEDIGLLAGIPMGIKDNLCTLGVRTTCASRVLENFIPPYESTVTQKLKDAGAIMLGKTNLDEFAMGSSTENSAYQITANPWDTERVPGGSSGGSAAAVAADECVVSLGSDTGGSIRQPASFCGVVGMKPTYGRVSRYGLVAFASSLDQIGPLAPTVEDAAILLQAIAGYDPRDSTSIKRDVPDYLGNLQKTSGNLKGRKVGVITETFGEGLDATVKEKVEAAIAQLKDLGAAVQEISCPQFRSGLPTYYIIAPSEASSNLARYDGVKYGVRSDDSSLMSMYTKTRAQGFGPEVKRRIMIGTYALSAGYYDAYYLKAQKVRTLIKQDFERAFGQVDVLVCPTAPTTAFKAGAVDDPLSMYLLDLMTIPVNLAGLPAMSLPCGFDDDGLPVGLQLIGNVLQEDLLFEVGSAYEQATDWHQQHPKLA